MPLMSRYLDDLERELHGLGRPGAALRDDVRAAASPTAGDRQARADPAGRVGPRGRRARRRAHRPGRPALDRPALLRHGRHHRQGLRDRRGEPLVAREFEVARADRFKKGCGLPIRVPVVELIEIGAGGGSHRPGGSHGAAEGRPGQRGRRSGPGLLRAGRAASRPSPTPTCSSATSTPTSSSAAGCGSTWRRPAGRSRRAWRSRWAWASPRPPGASTRWSTRTWRAPRASTAIERGKDLRGYPLFAFGGAGPVHAWQVGRHLAGAARARALRRGRRSRPRAAGRAARLRLRADRAAAPGRGRLGADQRAASQEMEAEGRRILRGAGVPDAEVTVRRERRDALLSARAHEVDVEMPGRASCLPASLAPITCLVRGGLSPALQPDAHGRAARGARTGERSSPAPRRT